MWYEAPVYREYNETELIEAAASQAQESAQTYEWWLAYFRPSYLTERCPASNGQAVRWIAMADWYNDDTDTCLVKLHPGMSAPSDWTELTRTEFIAAAAAAGKPNVTVAEAAWPE